MNTHLVPIRPPHHCELRSFDLAVIPAMPWKQAVAQTGDLTPEHYSIWRVGDQFPPAQEIGFQLRHLVLIARVPRSRTPWYDNRLSFEEAVEWSEGYGLKRSQPRDVFTLSNALPNLAQIVGANPDRNMFVASTEVCEQPDGIKGCCCAWWATVDSVPHRGAEFESIHCLGLPNCWYGFVL